MNANKTQLYFRRNIVDHKWLVISVFSLLAGVLSLIMLRRGLLTYADSWAYWEGSISLIERGEYAYFGGQPIVFWPPLFSAFLALFQLLLGVSGQTLVVAMVSLVMMNTFVWSWYSMDIIDASALAAPRKVWIVILVLSFVVLFLVSQLTILMANCLQLLFIGLAMLMGRLIMTAESPGSFSFRAWVMSLVLALALLVHNSSLAFLIPSLIFIWCNPRQKPFCKLLNGALMLALPFLAWAITRVLFAQTHSYPVQVGGFGPSLHIGILALVTFAIYFLPHQLSGIKPGLSPLACGTRALILPFMVCCIAIIHQLLRRRSIRTVAGSSQVNGTRGRQGAKPFVLFTLASFVLLYIILIVIGDTDDLCGRHLWWIPLIFMPIGIVVLARQSLWLATATCMLFMCIPTVRTAFYGAKGLVPALNASAAITASDFIPIYSQFTMSTLPKAPGPGLIKVSPPEGCWIDRNFHKTHTQGKPH
jgi:hypothetical protein